MSTLLADSRVSTRSELIKAQADLCASRSTPMFMPADGYCYRGHDVVAERGEGLRTAVVTGCPVCHRSFCD
jgi:hypothetical protein